MVIVGCGVIVGAASLVSVALAVLVAGVFLVGFGVVGLYVAAQLGKTPEKPARQQS